MKSEIFPFLCLTLSDQRPIFPYWKKSTLLLETSGNGDKANVHRPKKGFDFKQIFVTSLISIIEREVRRKCMLKYCFKLLPIPVQHCPLLPIIVKRSEMDGSVSAGSLIKERSTWSNRQETATVVLGELNQGIIVHCGTQITSILPLLGNLSVADSVPFCGAISQQEPHSQTSVTMDVMATVVKTMS